MTGRYYQDSSQDSKVPTHSRAEAKSVTADADKERDQLLASLEQQVAKEPSNEELWVLFALQHVDFGAVNSLKGVLQ